MQDGDVVGAAIEVQDRGEGLPADEQARVFDKFYRGRTSHRGGSGLVLTSSPESSPITAAVSLQSQPGGTTVTIVLPVAEGSG